ncbi:uncharacterized protein K460DRAFT_406793 [Cucurbitaria berberidis CBS 394.84]|uniref:Uncharacterized protein n=1 Tax=Cucurbitaria berberidis CBS 394.84 TaxID=1168544 RepID=A0A9P4GK61_9PLEO|nr:uncharacterized protein K460DRAFT_406793 [Cucurbitaria berberidis CBS 394.84]KAF1846595.1 hypothetical protein K460DRAFT_406793 [Cucurbitaria berberidis CBS 394.84]
MCYKLLQLYACGHSKTICTTPCPHAIDTARQATHLNGEQDTADLSRSSSVVSSIAPSVKRSDLHGLPSQRGSQALHSPGQPSPLHMCLPTQPAFRFVPPSEHPLQWPLPEYPQRSPASPTTRSPPLTFPKDSSVSSHLPGDEEQAVEPNYCPYHFPRYLVPSRRPCLECYVRPERGELPKAWKKKYKETHPYAKEEDVERLTGIAELRERMGLGQ